MDFALSEEQELLQETVRSFVEKECPAALARQIFDGDRGPASKLWRGLAEMGVAGLVVPEKFGGAGLALLDLALVSEELGRGVVPVPFLGHALASLALAQGGSAAQQARWLPKLASGEALAAVALGRARPERRRRDRADRRARRWFPRVVGPRRPQASRARRSPSNPIAAARSRAS